MSRSSRYEISSTISRQGALVTTAQGESSVAANTIGGRGQVERRDLTGQP